MRQPSIPISYHHCTAQRSDKLLSLQQQLNSKLGGLRAVADFSKINLICIYSYIKGYHFLNYINIYLYKFVYLPITIFTAINKKGHNIYIPLMNKQQPVLLTNFRESRLYIISPEGHSTFVYLILWHRQYECDGLANNISVVKVKT